MKPQGQSQKQGNGNGNIQMNMPMGGHQQQFLQSMQNQMMV